MSRVFAQHDFVALPVVDTEGRMKGVVTIDDIVDVVQEEATEDAQKFGGMEALDLPYLQSTWREMLTKRGGWLAILLIGTLGDFQGHATIGDYVRTHSSVFIAHHARIGNFVWIFPHVVLTDDPHPPSEVRRGVVVEDYASIATMSASAFGAKNLNPVAVPSASDSSVQSTTESTSPPVAWTIGGVP